MKGLKIKCPNCKRCCFETTKEYDPDKTPNGSMVVPLVHYAIDWLCSITTTVSEMTCPECLAPLARNNRLTVVHPPGEETRVSPGSETNPAANETKVADPSPSFVDREGAFHCFACNPPRAFKSKAALNGHTRTHYPKGKKP